MQGALPRCIARVLDHCADGRLHNFPNRSLIFHARRLAVVVCQIPCKDSLFERMKHQVNLKQATFCSQLKRTLKPC